MNDANGLTTRDRAIYGTGYLGVSLTTFAITTWLAGYYLPPEEGAATIFPGMTIFGKAFAATALFGIAMSAGRIVDALSDPLIGYLSDNTRSRWGRRRPYILFGTPFLAIFFILAFNPPMPTGSPGNFYFLISVISVFYLFYTIVITPYLSLLPEIARGTSERLKLASWQTIFNMAGLIVAMIIGGIMVHALGYRWMSIIFATLILISFIFSALKTKERPTVATQPRMGFGAALAQTFRNGPFLIYVFSQLFIWFGFNLVIASLKHIVVALMGFSTTGVALVMFLTLGMVIITIPLVLRLAKQWGKKKTYLVMVSMFIIGFAAIFLMKSPMLSDTGSRILGLCIFFMVGIPSSAFFVIPNTIMGEIIDFDHKTTGRRREAIYFSAQALINKFGLAFSSLYQGFIFTYGYQAGNPLGIRLLGPSAAIFVMIGLAIFYFYPLEDPKFLRKRGEDTQG